MTKHETAPSGCTWKVPSTARYQRPHALLSRHVLQTPHSQRQGRRLKTDEELREADFAAYLGSDDDGDDDDEEEEAAAAGGGGKGGKEDAEALRARYRCVRARQLDGLAGLLLVGLRCKQGVVCCCAAADKVKMCCLGMPVAIPLTKLNRAHRCPKCIVMTQGAIAGRGHGGQVRGARGRQELGGRRGGGRRGGRG